MTTLPDTVPDDIEALHSLGSQVLYRLTDLFFTLLTLFFLYRHGTDLARQFRLLAGSALGEASERVIGRMLSAVRGAVNGLPASARTSAYS